ncbi:A disintegrin and metalloproteinase with thrombospondin motifs 6 isoform X2 [Biomphalaria glabrata]|nr:A disintegrin and metalloproteinase with thrombospondin motifs 6 isoform X2 [Biomphalaria glabrata]
MCRTNGKSSSVIEDRQEDRYSISTSQTVAHELAHGLSARHDGENNLCNASERYIMGYPDAEKKPGTEYNPWLFSPCSVIEVTLVLSTLSKHHDVSDKLLGQVIKPDQQCQQFFVNDSFFCRASESRRSITEICQAMLCADVLRGLCIPHIALTGTSCSDGKNVNQEI